MRTFTKAALFILICAAAVSAADITGDWEAVLDHPQGPVQVSYTFKQDGEKLTGTWQAAASGVVEITEGKVIGEKISFVVNVEKVGVVLRHEGKIVGNEIQLEMKPVGEFPGSTVVAKRVKK